MLNKISALLFNQTYWKIVFNQKIYAAQEMRLLIFNISSQINRDRIKADDYLIAVGFNSFEYILYIMVASLLGLKIILCDPKMLNTLLTYYKLPYAGVIASRKID